ncbi:DNA/RNA nuclease SfsA [Ureaplasma ceti]|uniref:Sugar fermentation stimulation protein n=1 Tax=Ureaplasma ceti TaxID=3119530 RepID=A0ABP9UCM4_9BACT
MIALKFDEPLTEGLIIDRPNRFIMKVAINNKIEYCHCPATSRIGDIIFDKIPCLLSKNNDWSRRTVYSVEAISLDNKKTWIGINQTKSNNFIDYFLRVGSLKKIFQRVNDLEREVFYIDSKLDFFVNQCFLEVKSPLTTINTDVAKTIMHYEEPIKDYSNRFLRHVNTLRTSLTEKARAILLVCFQYDRPPFEVKWDTIHENYLSTDFKSAVQSGVEVWQCNLIFDKEQVAFKRCINLTDYYLSDYDSKPN